ncbi:hypothetical protein ASL14_24065 [Paenibacillus sp. IHB B 3084]|uniref:SIS domain-containing protein n=1 Tax=Paenibacillus sp. IHB B 3084 TaxID=867076 RepID=UPI000721C98A|nr:SIS domain-containing protein [Paenibacillus sp. IHB B 3084]ALP38778.1 hypothetical protein ASL14_24065 [Paenibacillus sp. IHB B 3084]
MFQYYKDLITLSEQVLTKELMINLSNYILSSKHLFVSGIMESFVPGKFLETKLRKLGLYISSIHSSELNDVFNYAQTDDLLILFSMRGNTSVLGQFLSQRESFKGKVLLITMNRNSKYKDLVDKMVVLPQITLSTSLNQTKTDILFYVFVENLVSYIAYLLNDSQ